MRVDEFYREILVAPGPPGVRQHPVWFLSNHVSMSPWIMTLHHHHNHCYRHWPWQILHSGDQGESCNDSTPLSPVSPVDTLQIIWHSTTNKLLNVVLIMLINFAIQTPIPDTYDFLCYLLPIRCMYVSYNWS